MTTPLPEPTPQAQIEAILNDLFLGVADLKPALEAATKVIEDATWEARIDEAMRARLLATTTYSIKLQVAELTERINKLELQRTKAEVLTGQH